MKRNPDDVIFVWRIFPIFYWYTCAKCSMEIRREWIWKVWKATHFVSSGPLNKYLFYCKDCCPTKEDAWKERCLNENS